MRQGLHLEAMSFRFMHKNLLAATYLTGVSVFALISCGETAGTGKAVSLPTVALNCTASNCLTGGSATAYLTLTTSGCTNPNFGATATSSGTVSCNASAGCIGTAGSWIDSQGQHLTTVQSGNYSICGTINFNGTYAGVAQRGDASGALDAVKVDTGTPTQNLILWTNVQ